MRQGLCATSHPRKATSDLSAARILFPEYTTLLLGEDEIYSHWVTTSICEKTVRLQFLVGTTLLFFAVDTRPNISSKRKLGCFMANIHLPCRSFTLYGIVRQIVFLVAFSQMASSWSVSTERGGSDFLKCESEDRMDIREIRAT